MTHRITAIHRRDAWWDDKGTHVGLIGIPGDDWEPTPKKEGWFSGSFQLTDPDTDPSSTQATDGYYYFWAVQIEEVVEDGATGQ